MRLTINLVTRGRPERVVDTIRRTLPMIAEASTRFVVSIDDDDERTLSALFREGFEITIDSRPREDALGAKWDRGLEYKADVYWAMADYTPYITPAFDTKILEAAALFPDGIGVVYSNMANMSFPRSQGATHGLVEKLGFMYPPYFPFWFVDHWLDDIAKLIGRISYADVDVDAGAVKLPTQEMREVAWWATFFDSQRLVRRRQARAIIDSPDFLEPEWRKEILRRNHPLVEFGSQCINDQVRAMRWPATLPGGPRYDRLKAKATEMMRAEWPAMQQDLALNG